MKLQTKQNVVVPWDFSKMSRDSLLRATEMVDDISLIRIVHVSQVPSAYEYGVVWEMISEDTIREKLLAAFYDELAQDDRFNSIDMNNLGFDVFFGDPGQRICEFATDESAELIVISSHGRSGLSRWMLGSVAERVVRFAGCPVLVLRETDEHACEQCSDSEKQSATT